MKANVLGKDRGPNVQTIHNICLKLNSKIGKYVSNDSNNNIDLCTEDALVNL